MILKDSYQNQSHPRSHPYFLARDPRVLMAAFGLIVMFTLVIRDTKGLALALVYVLCLHAAARMPVRAFAKNAKVVIPFVLLILVVNAVLVSGEPLTPLIPFLSYEGLASGIRYGVRLFVLYFAITLFLSVTSPEDIARGIAAILSPFSQDLARRAALHSFLSIGYLPLFSREIDRIRVAQRFRGGGLDGGPLKRLNGARLLLVPLFLSAIQRSAQLAMVVELRDIKTTIAPLLTLEPVSRRDLVFAGVTVIILVVSWRVI
jgi:energy-coupling factor transport system permease protein